MTKPNKPPAPPEFNPDYVRDISLAVYLDRLGPDGTQKARARFEGGEAEFDKLMRDRAACQDTLTKAYLRAIHAQPVTVTHVSKSGGPFKQPDAEPETVELDTSQIKVVNRALKRSLKPPLRGRKSPGYVAKPPKSTK